LRKAYAAAISMGGCPAPAKNIAKKKSQTLLPEGSYSQSLGFQNRARGLSRDARLPGPVWGVVDARIVSVEKRSRREHSLLGPTRTGLKQTHGGRTTWEKKPIMGQSKGRECHAPKPVEGNKLSKSPPTGIVRGGNLPIGDSAKKKEELATPRSQK